MKICDKWLKINKLKIKYNETFGNKDTSNSKSDLMIIKYELKKHKSWTKF